jgi:putative endonuclease
VYYLYILESEKDGNLYTGISADVRRRLAEHNGGRVRSTKPRRPFRLLYTETFSSRSEAFVRETYFKTPEGGALKQRLVANARLKDNDPR